MPPKKRTQRTRSQRSQRSQPVTEEARLERQLEEIAAELHALELARSEVVAKLRERRVPWERIGALSGMSRAGAHRKWGPSTTRE